MTSSTGKQIITKHILSKISISKDNQTIKFGQLIEYKVRNFFSSKSCWENGNKNSSRLLFAY